MRHTIEYYDYITTGIVCKDVNERLVQNTGLWTTSRILLLLVFITLRFNYFYMAQHTLKARLN